MRLKRRSKLRPGIPFASMADIAFLLLVFFIVTSSMKMDEASRINIPAVPQTEKVGQNARLDIWLDKSGRIEIRRRGHSLVEVAIYMVQRMRRLPATVVFLNGDRDAPFSRVEALLKVLSDAGAVRVVFVAREGGADAPE